MASQTLIQKKNSFLKPTQVIELTGRISYSESDRCWNRLRIKREILQDYPDLKNKRGNFGYTMIIPKTEKELKKAMEEIKNQTIPILLFFNKNVESD